MIAIKLLWDHYISRFYGFQGMIFRSPRSGRGHAPQDVGCGKADRLQVFSCSGMVRTAHPRTCASGCFSVGCAVRTIFLQDIGHHGATHPARASRATGAAKSPTRSLIFHFYRGHGPLLPPRPCSSERAVPAMAAGARSLTATGHAGRRSGRGGVPALERGHDQSCPKLMGSRRGRSLDQGIDIPFLSRAWPAPSAPPRRRVRGVQVPSG